MRNKIWFLKGGGKHALGQKPRLSTGPISNKARATKFQFFFPSVVFQIKIKVAIVGGKNQHLC